MARPSMPGQLPVAMTTMGKDQTKTEKKCCMSSRSKPHPCPQISHKYSSHSFQIPPFYIDLSMYLVSLPKLG